MLYDRSADWLSETDWHLDSVSDWYRAGCDAAIMDSGAYFHNTLFCVPTLTTWTSHDPNHVEALPDISGVALVSWTMFKQGDCGDLLDAFVDYAVYQTQ